MVLTDQGPWWGRRFSAAFGSWQLRVLRLVLAIPFLAALARVVYLQAGVGEVLRARSELFTVQTRAFAPARAAIRLRSGEALAEDGFQVSVVVHYRYLQSPLDRNWLEREALRTLPADARRDPRHRHRAVAELQQQAVTLLPRLSAILGIPTSELAARASAIDQRVRRLKTHLLRRQPPGGRGEHRFLLKPEPPSLWHRLTELFGEPQNRPVRPEPWEIAEEKTYYEVARVQDPSRFVMLVAALDQLPGVRLQTQTQRLYPAGSLAAHVVGYVLPKGAELTDQVSSLAGSSGVVEGRAGVEGYYDAELRGQYGWVREAQWPDGSTRVLSGSPGAPGREVVLTLDRQLQPRAERWLAQTCQAASSLSHRASGAVLVMDVHTGALRAAASWPTFEPSDVSNPSGAFWRHAGATRETALYSRFHQAALPPGSLFKTLVAAAALETGLIDPDQPLHCQGYLSSPDRFRCWIYVEHQRGHGALTLRDALAQSCNVYFFQLAERLGAQRLLQWARWVGFGEPTGIDLVGENAGFLPTPQALWARLGRAWQPYDLRNLSIGQGDLLVTPLQVARWLAVVANGGYLVQPHVREGLIAPPHRLPFSQRTLQLLHEALLAVVHDPRGSAHRAFHGLPIRVAGKTGTAESGLEGHAHSWFAGYFPAEQPSFVIVVLVEHGGKGSDTAAGLARRVLEEWAASTTTALQTPTVQGAP
jgi:penicillin-binding protein 2